MVGFVQQIGANSSSMAKHKVTCFAAIQEKHYDIEHTKLYNTGKMKYNKITSTKHVSTVDLTKPEISTMS